MPNLIKQTDTYSNRARTDRSIQSGRVVSTNTVDNTSILDVGMVDFDGNPVYMIDVPFSPQTPPQLNDTVAILRTNSSPYSHVTGAGSAVGGANTAIGGGQTVKAGGAVTSLRKLLESVEVLGDITFSDGLGITLTRVGQNFEWKATTPSISVPSWIVREIPSGAINSSNTAFTLAYTPVVGSEMVFLNGLLQQSGGADYSISGASITYVSAPATGDLILVTYQSNGVPGGGGVIITYPSYDFSQASNSMYVPMVF